jgi:radical SAM protein with 4Fe4S-binding SPASM domain
MFIALNPRWHFRLEPWGAMAHDFHRYESRMLSLNRPAAIIVALAERRPRARSALESLFSRSAPVVDDLLRRGLLLSVEGQDAEPIRAEEVAGLERDIEGLPAHALSAPAEVLLQTHMRCNVQCSFCYLPLESREDPNGERMDESTLRAVLQHCLETRVFAVTFVGGEPFVDAGSITTALREFGDKFSFSILTNGTIFPKPDLFSLLQQDTVAVAFSIHSARAEIHDRITNSPGSFARAWSNVERMAHAGIATVLQLVLTKDSTLEDVLAFVERARDAGARGCRVSHMYPGPNMTIDQYFDLALPPERVAPISRHMDELRQRYGSSFFVYPAGMYGFVHAGKMPERESALDDFVMQRADGTIQVAIFPDGSVRFAANTTHEEAPVIGKIPDTSLAQIWRSERFKETVFEPRIPVAPCDRCEYLSFCGGGGPELSLRLRGATTGGDPRCPRVWNHWMQDPRHLRQRKYLSTVME